MNSDIIPHSAWIVNSLTPQQARVWQRLTSAPPEARNADGRVRADYLAEAWPGGATVPGWKNLLRVTIHGLNHKLEPHSIRVAGHVGGSGPRAGGYEVIVGKERAA